MMTEIEMTKGQTLEQYVAQIRKECALALAERDEQIALLTAENIKLKETIAQLKCEQPQTVMEEEFELDMKKILHPDGRLELAELCRDLGLMNDD